MSEDTNTCGGSCACATTATETASYRRPQFRVNETSEAYELDVLVPGVDKAGVEVSLDDGTLSVTARRATAAPENWRPLRQEIPAEDYRLTLRVNVPVDEAHIEATVADGVLRLRLPKAEQAKPRKIDVR